MGAGLPARVPSFMAECPASGTTWNFVSDQRRWSSQAETMGTRLVAAVDDDGRDVADPLHVVEQLVRVTQERAVREAVALDPREGLGEHVAASPGDDLRVLVEPLVAPSQALQAHTARMRTAASGLVSRR